MPHLAGTPGGIQSADYVKKEWIKQGLDSVQMSSYNVLLDFPDELKFNNIEIRNSRNELENFYEIKEPIVDKQVHSFSQLNISKISKPFLAYTKNGSLTFVILFLFYLFQIIL